MTGTLPVLDQRQLAAAVRNVTATTVRSFARTSDQCSRCQFVMICTDFVLGSCRSVLVADGWYRGIRQTPSKHRANVGVTDLGDGAPPGRLPRHARGQVPGSSGTKRPARTAVYVYARRPACYLSHCWRSCDAPSWTCTASGPGQGRRRPIRFCRIECGADGSR